MREVFNLVLFRSGRGSSSAIFLSTILLLTIPKGAVAYDPGMEAVLLRSRNSLLQQRDELQKAGDAIDRKIADLSKQRDYVENCVRNTDRALRDVEYALK